MKGGGFKRQEVLSGRAGRGDWKLIWAELLNWIGAGILLRFAAIFGGKGE